MAADFKSLKNLSLITTTSALFLTLGFYEAFCAKTLQMSDIFAPYLKMHSYEVTVSTATSLTPVKGGPGTSLFGTINVAYSAPNKTHIEITGLTGGAELVSDGLKSYSYSAMTNTYSESPASQKPLSMLMGLFGNVQGLHQNGTKVVNGHACNIFIGKINSGVGPGTLTLSTDSTSKLIDQVIMNVPSFEGPRGGRYNLRMTEDYSNQRINPIIPASAFHFSPPSGAQKSASSTLPSILGSSSTGMP